MNSVLAQSWKLDAGDHGAPLSGLDWLPSEGRLYVKDVVTVTCFYLRQKLPKLMICPRQSSKS